MINWTLFPFPASVDSENEAAVPEAKAGKETIDIKELMRVDHILASLQRKVCWNYIGFPCFYSLFNKRERLLKTKTKKRKMFRKYHALVIYRIKLLNNINCKCMSSSTVLSSCWRYRYGTVMCFYLSLHLLQISLCIQLVHWCYPLSFNLKFQILVCLDVFLAMTSNIMKLWFQLPPAPPPPPFPEGYMPPPTAETEKGPEGQEAGESQAPQVDPIIDQGPAKRMKVWYKREKLLITMEMMVQGKHCYH